MVYAVQFSEITIYRVSTRALKVRSEGMKKRMNKE